MFRVVHLYKVAYWECDDLYLGTSPTPTLYFWQYNKTLQATKVQIILDFADQVFSCLVDMAELSETLLFLLKIAVTLPSSHFTYLKICQTSAQKITHLSSVRESNPQRKKPKPTETYKHKPLPPSKQKRLVFITWVDFGV